MKQRQLLLLLAEAPKNYQDKCEKTRVENQKTRVENEKTREKTRVKTRVKNCGENQETVEKNCGEN